MEPISNMQYIRMFKNVKLIQNLSECKFVNAKIHDKKVNM